MQKIRLEFVAWLLLFDVASSHKNQWDSKIEQMFSVIDQLEDSITEQEELFQDLHKDIEEELQDLKPISQQEEHQLDKAQTEIWNCQADSRRKEQHILQLSQKFCRSQEKLLTCRTALRQTTYRADYYARIQGAKTKPLKLNQNCLRLENVNGSYTIKQGLYTLPTQCDSSWTLVQRQNNNNLMRKWLELKSGYGESMDAHDYFIGLDTFYNMTRERSHEMLINIQYNDNTCGFGYYNHVSIGNQFGSDKLKSVGQYLGSLPNHLRKCVNQTFTAENGKSDQLPFSNCVQHALTGYNYLYNNYKSSIFLMRPLL